MHSEDPHDDPVVVYRTIAILMAAFAIALLFIPFDWMAAGGKTHEFVAVLVGAIGETGTRLLFAIPCAGLALLAGRFGWGHPGD